MRSSTRGMREGDVWEGERMGGMHKEEDVMAGGGSLCGGLGWAYAMLVKARIRVAWPGRERLC